MKYSETELPGVLLLEHPVYQDQRGFFAEYWRHESFLQIGINISFVQDSISSSTQNVIRGLHYQYPREQAKLVTVLQGEIFDVAVDIRQSSPTFGRWTGMRLNAEKLQQLYIPAGFAHGFCALSEQAVISYKMSDYYDPGSERGIRWNDPDIGIRWPCASPIVSVRDAGFCLLKEMPATALAR